MAKVNINTDKIEKDLLPEVQKVVTQTSFAKSYAAKVSFPYGEYNWNNVYNKIEDCEENIIKYKGWISGLNKKYKNDISNNVEDINSISVEKVRPQILTVK